MTIVTWVTLIVIGGFVWGGFALAIRTAIRREAGKDG